MIVLLSRSGIQKITDHCPYLKTEDFLESLPKPGTMLELQSGATSVGYGYSGKGHRYDACVLDGFLSEEFFFQKLHIAYQKRKKNFSPSLPQAYRLIHSEADALPGITIEVFLKYGVITYFNQGLIIHEQKLIAALNKLLPLQGIYTKYRTPEHTNTHTQLASGTSAPEELIISEPTGLYSVRLNDGLMTGLFLDQRANRKWLQQHASNKNICNTFSYTGSLSIACGLGDASSTKSIDLSRTYSDWARHNLDINDLFSPKHETITSDTFDHFAYCNRKGIKYDMIILDPPTFAKNKKGNFSVPDNYQNLVIEASNLLTNKGLLVACTNYSQWTLSQFKKLLQKWIQHPHHIIQESNADLDFPKHPYWAESEHLKCIVIQLAN